MSAVPDSILFISFETVSVIFPPHNSEYAPTGIEQSAFKVLITHRSVSKSLKGVNVVDFLYHRRYKKSFLRLSSAIIP